VIGEDGEYSKYEMIFESWKYFRQLLEIIIYFILKRIESKRKQIDIKFILINVIRIIRIDEILDKVRNIDSVILKRRLYQLT
jgi:hypothetical protein